MRLLVRAYSESDLIAICRVWNASGLCRAPLTLQQTRNLFSKSTMGLVITNDGRVVGAMRAVPCADGLLTRLAVVELSVLPQYRQNGLGRALLSGGLALLPKYGFTGLFLPAIKEENLAATALCTACGLQKSGVLPDFFGPGQCAASFYYACPPKQRKKPTQKDRQKEKL